MGHYKHPRSSCRRRSTRRRLRIEQLEVRYALDASLVALANDAFDLQQNGPQVELDVLANDAFDSQYLGQRLITSASYGSQGGRIQIAADRQSILYTPPADFFGSETFVYAVDGQFTAQVEVSIRSPLEFDHFYVPPDGQERTLDVLANDPFWSGYTGERRITAVSVASEGGTIEVGPNGQTLLYTPPEGAFGKESFIYIVDELYPAQVTVEIPKTLEGDTFEIIQHSSAQSFHVLANDPFWPGYTGERRITHLAGVSSGATIVIAGDGQSLIYTPAENASGWDSFRYVVDGSYEASVSVVIYRPVQDDWFEVDQNSTDFYFNVIANDTYRDLNNQVHDVIDRVTSVTQPDSGGTVTMASGGQGILYTPPAGFSGSDTFTYLADGVHEATVYVQVTRPVRDDYISSVVIQDTPNAVLNVLANDFVGNGYAGPRLITAVGPTENGGVLTISGDGKTIRYTPAPGYTGQDRFSYTVDGSLEAEVTLNVRPLAQNDYFQFNPDPPHGPYSLDVLANDYFGQGYTGPGIITSAEFVYGNGEVHVIGGDTLLFNPAMAGGYSLRYVVDGKYEATVSLGIRNAVVPDHFVVDQNSPSTQLSVLVNDFYFYNYVYGGPRQITGVTQSEHGGSVSFDSTAGIVSYAPPPDFYGSDSFTYTVDDFMTATVTVEVIRRVRDDQFRVDQADGQQALPVLVNDLFGANYAGPGQITAVTASSAGGTATISADGRSVLYTPAAGFVGTDTFTYTVDGALKAEVSVIVDAPRDQQLPQFGSLEEYTQFLIDDALVRYEHLFGQIAWDYEYLGPVDFDGPGVPTVADRGHSETNVQVAGVDEGDIVEFDSDYVYMLTDDELVILDAWPADELSIASRVDVEGRTIAEFLHGDRLTIISEVGGGYDWLYWDSDIISDGWWPQFPVLPSSTIVTVLDVSDRTAPTIVQKTTMEGKYVDSRGVGDFVYVLVDNPNAIASRPKIIDEDNDPATLGRYETRDEYLARVTANPGEFVEAALPNYSSYDANGELVRNGLLNAPEDVYQPLVAGATNLISVVSFNIEGDEPGLADTSAVYSTGASAIYASLENFYVFDKDYSPEDGALTRIAKFDWDPATGGVDFAATTTVVGSILNQFSADENGDYLRIATTAGNDASGNWSGRDENLLFVLQEDGGVFEFVGSLQNLALDETMRSVRFMGDRAFVTTFRSIDPLFAIDLSEPARPESVGHVTLPGFTSYMHLVDENHLLTVGRNTPVGTVGPTQVSLFDISDLTQPLRTAEYTFERFSTSEAEIDHHAFGYFAEHGLLGMPVARTYYVRVDTDGDGYRETRQAVTENELAVFTVDVLASEPSQRLALAAQIAHGSPVRRSGYIGDKLYSIANDSVKVVDVANPDVVLAEVTVEADEDDIHAEPVSPMMAAIDRARRHLADRLGLETGAPMLVTTEAAPDAPGGGWHVVFRVGDSHYLYRAAESGLVEFVESGYEFGGSGSDAWHAVEIAAPQRPMAIAGDFNLDGRVDDGDRAIWKQNFGNISLTAFLPTDGNGNGIVDSGDYTVWQDNLGKIAGDYDGNGLVDDEDCTFWKANFGATSGSGLAADGNGDGQVGAADYTFWRDMLGQSGLTSFSGADGSGNGSVGPDDYDVWKSHFGQTLQMDAGSGAAAASATTGQPPAPSGVDAAEVLMFAGVQAKPPADFGELDRAEPVAARPMIGLDVRRDDALSAWFAARKWDRSNHIDQQADGLTSSESGDTSAEAWDEALSEWGIRWAIGVR